MGMRLRVMILAAALIGAPAAMATADDDVGCGLGAKLLDGKSGMWMKAFAAIINGSSSNQAFGISSGTLGCSPEGTVTAQERVQLFADANFDRLAVDMAHGQGETLATFATLLDVPADQQGALFTLVRSNFASLYPTDDVTAGDMLATLFDLMQADPALAAYALG